MCMLPRDPGTIRFRCHFLLLPDDRVLYRSALRETQVFQHERKQLLICFSEIKRNTSSIQRGYGKGMSEPDKVPSSLELRDRIKAMSRGRKIVLVVFIIWAIQAIPKWTAAIVADGETSAAIMKFFITPR